MFKPFRKSDNLQALRTELKMLANKGNVSIKVTHRPWSTYPYHVLITNLTPEPTWKRGYSLSKEWFYWTPCAEASGKTEAKALSEAISEVERLFVPPTIIWKHP